MVRLIAVLMLVMAAAAAPAEEPMVGLPLTGDEAVAFLRSAEMVGRPEAFDALAITEPELVSLTDGERTFRAIFKDVHVLHRSFPFADGREVRMIWDSYRHEIAAYELDRLLGLELVPPCVERSLLEHTGSLCLWVEGSRTEDERRQRGLEPPDREAWIERMILVKAFQQLISDQDYCNIRNILVDDHFHVYKVDSSMAFYSDRKLRDEDHLARFSRGFLESLGSLERSEVDARLGPWLNKHEIKALWQRRDRMLELARERVAAQGEEKVLY